MPPDPSDNIVTIPREQADLYARTSALLENMLNDPRTAEQAESLVQTINPQAKFPMRDRREALVAPVLGELAKERAKIAALEAREAARDAKEAAAEQARVESSMVSRMETVKSRRGFSDDMMQRVMDRMRENNSPDVEAAAAFVAESIPKPAPSAGYDFLPTTVDAYGSVSGDDKWKALHENSDKWLTQELRDIARDPEFARLGNG